MDGVIPLRGTENQDRIEATPRYALSDDLKTVLLFLVFSCDTYLFACYLRTLP